MFHLPTNTISREFYLSHQARHGQPGTGGCESWLFCIVPHILLGVSVTESQASMHKPTPMYQHLEVCDAREATSPLHTRARPIASVIKPTSTCQWSGRLQRTLDFPSQVEPRWSLSEHSNCHCTHSSFTATVKISELTTRAKPKRRPAGDWPPGPAQ